MNADRVFGCGQPSMAARPSKEGSSFGGVNGVSNASPPGIQSRPASGATGLAADAADVR